MYKRILVPVDGSPASRRGLDEAIKLAKSSGASLRIVHAATEFLDQGYTPSVYYDRVMASLREAGKKLIGDVETIARKHAVPFESALLETAGGRVCDLIVDDAKQWPADLIVMGTHGRRGVHRLALGSDAEMVLRCAPVPVVMVRSAAEAPPGLDPRSVT
jgi:nucleotide-binding universal stress UspA family protein